MDMKAFLFIIKGVLLYFTLIYWILMICLADSFTSIGILIVFGIGFCLILLCKDIISKEDLIKLLKINPKDLDETV